MSGLAGWSALGWSGSAEDEELLLELDDDELLLELLSPGNGNLSLLGLGADEDEPLELPELFSPGNGNLSPLGLVLDLPGAGASGAAVVEAGGAWDSPGNGNCSAVEGGLAAGVQGFCVVEFVLAGQGGGGAEFWAGRVWAAASSMAEMAIWAVDRAAIGLVYSGQR